MIEAAFVKKLWRLWILLCLFIVLLNILFPLESRSGGERLAIFVLTGLAIMLTWFLIVVTVFSNLGPSFFKSLPRSLFGPPSNYLIFFKFVMTKEAYKKAEQLLNETNNSRR